MSDSVSTMGGGADAPPFLVRVARALDTVMLWSASIVACVTLPLLFVSICIDVVIRYATNQSIPWLSEIQSIMFPWLILSGVAIAALWGRHIALDAVTRMLPNILAYPLMMMVQVLAAATFFYLTWVGIEMLDVVGGEVFPVTGLESSWAYMALVAGFLFLALTSLSNMALLVYADDPFVFRWGLEEESETPVSTSVSAAVDEFQKEALQGERP